MWDLQVGSRSASLKPNFSKIIAVSINSTDSQIATVGLDAKNRHQIIVWDIKSLINLSGVVNGADAPASVIIARQLSDFSINKICYHPFDESQIVTSGRENIRVWRQRKNHLPGRPICLNDYSRGYVFSDIAFDCDQNEKLFFYVASNKGLVLKISYASLQVICAYQLHKTQINCFQIKFGYALSGSEDNLLRVWPLDFKDFLLEARHEGSLTSINIGFQGHKVAIGTNSGTLGILHVSDHRYLSVIYVVVITVWFLHQTTKFVFFFPFR